MYTRKLDAVLRTYAKFPVVALLGPRQSGKTTLVRDTFKNHQYVSFEHPDTRREAEIDPQQFLRTHENEYGIIIDEFQYVPHILSYIQLTVDEKKRPGYFVLTGSQNFLMNEAITQSLAGRVGILTLLSFSLEELAASNLLADIPEEAIFKGGYPRIYAENFLPLELYPSYIQTYVERDVRQLVNVGDLRTFQRLMQLCAGHIGQQINFSQLAGVCGVSVPTVQRWISVLEASYIIFFLQPHFKNFNKRLTKSPKLYFYDTGLACSLLGFEFAKNLIPNSMYGHLFENFIIADLCKQYFNRGLRPPLYFWRDMNGRLEVDCLVEQHNQLTPIEIKSGETVAADFFSGLSRWAELAQLADTVKRYVVYGGKGMQERSAGTLVGWREVNTLIDVIRSDH